MPLYLIDKNVLENIRKSVRGEASGAAAAFARAIDRKSTLVSPLLAIIEGSHRRPPTAQELHDNMLQAVQALGLFYRHAGTDGTALMNLGVDMALSFTSHMQRKTLPFIPLTQKLQILLAKTYTLRDSWGVLERMFQAAEEEHVDRRHPVVTIAVACLFGDGDARRVIKPAQRPTEADAYNVLADLRYLAEAAYVREMWQRTNPRFRVNFYTEDKGLSAMDKSLRMKAQPRGPATQDTELIAFTSTLDLHRLPLLRGDERLVEKLESALAT